MIDHQNPLTRFWHRLHWRACVWAALRFFVFSQVQVMELAFSPKSLVRTGLLLASCELINGPTRSTRVQAVSGTLDPWASAIPPMLEMTW